MPQQLWAGVDAGKAEHHCVVIDVDGKRVLSRRVANDEATLGELINAVTALADGGDLTRAIDLAGGGAALLIALLTEACQRLLYIPGRSVYCASGSYRGDAKSAAKDAAIIADQARMRRDLQPLRGGDEITVELRILAARRADLVADRTRALNRLRARLLECFPALERAFDYGQHKAAPILFTGYQTPRGTTSRRRRAAGRLAAETQGPHCRGGGRRRTRSCPCPAHGVARTRSGRRDGGPASPGGDQPRHPKPPTLRQ